MCSCMIADLLTDKSLYDVFHVFIVEQIPGAIFQGGGLMGTTFVIIYQNVRLGL